MSNFKTWNVRKRHEWLATPLKKKRVKRRTARRAGMAVAPVAEAAPAADAQK